MNYFANGLFGYGIGIFVGVTLSSVFAGWIASAIIFLICLMLLLANKTNG